MDKKGFLRIVEAFIAMLLILTVVLIAFTSGNIQERTDFSEMSRDILEEMSRNPGLRNEVLRNPGPTGAVDNFVNNKLSDSLGHEIRFCEINEVCGQSSYREGDVFSGERIISSTIEKLNPKKVRLFIWIKD